MYEEGLGVPENDAKAVFWFRMAAKQGHIMSQNTLGFMYSNGEGVPQDLVQAYAWWSVAATQGDEYAKEHKGIMEKVMTRERIAEAQKLSSEYWEKYVVPFQ